ncbi:putative glycoside hydrolase [Vibrio taketomensis]|uniref:putative glycoside hydrolase n=1 Tax=Vibrio taketomensis TaxID=2572923 RepID=UPI00138A31F0|nr:putative glycoside hydrolase [Vibrio taketomensis]
MTCNVFNKKLLATLICTAGLTGCLDDPYNEPDTSTPPPTSQEIPLYSPNGDSAFILAITDSSGTEAIVDGNNVSQGNVSVTNISGEKNGMLNVTITDNKSGRIALTSGDSSNVNLNVDPATSTLQFSTRAMSLPSSGQEIYITSQKEHDTDIGKVSLTSSYTASYKGSTQTIKIPLSCFTEAGMDFNDAISPFTFVSNNNLNFDLGNIRIVTNSINQQDVLECDNTSTLLQADDPSDAFKASKVFVVGSPSTGWATAVTNWMTVGNSTLHWGHDHIRIEYSNAPAGENGGLVLATQDKSLKDISNYVDSGVLQFMFYVDSYANHPTKRFQVQMESSTHGNSEPYFLPAGAAEKGWQQIQVPLRDLFTRKDGSININALRNIDKAVSILPEWVEGEDTLQGMDFSIGSVQVVVP